MKKIVTKPKKTFFEQNKDLIVVGGVIVVLAGGAVAYMYYKKKKEAKAIDLAQNKDSSQQVIPVHTTMPVSSSSGSSSSASKPRIKYVKTGYPLKYKTRHQDVKILQAYLKIYKEKLGKSGAKRDGVDGVFGPLTLKAAKKRLSKSEFTEKDIAGMRKALKMMGK